MINTVILDLFPVISDILERYAFFRGQAILPEKSRDLLLSEYAREMEDEDDSIIVLAGIALAQWDCSELEEDAKKQIQALINRRLLVLSRDEEKEALTEILLQLSKTKPLTQKRNTLSNGTYSLRWAVGDTFSHQLTHPEAEKAGILGWYLLFRKVGSYNDNKGRKIQLGYVTICPPGNIPQTTQELNSLGFLHVMKHGRKWDYLVQIDVLSKRAEKNLQFVWIGRFIDAASPFDEMKSAPEVSMPLFDGIDNKTGCPRYESVFCRFYRWYGIGGTDNNQWDQTGANQEGVFPIEEKG